MEFRYSYEARCVVCGETAWSGYFQCSENDPLQRWLPPFGWVGVIDHRGFTNYYCPKHRVFVKDETLKEVINYDG